MKSRINVGRRPIIGGQRRRKRRGGRIRRRKQTGGIIPIIGPILKGLLGGILVG